MPDSPVVSVCNAHQQLSLPRRIRLLQSDMAATNQHEVIRISGFDTQGNLSTARENIEDGHWRWTAKGYAIKSDSEDKSLEIIFLDLDIFWAWYDRLTYIISCIYMYVFYQLRSHIGKQITFVRLSFFYILARGILCLATGFDWSWCSSNFCWYHIMTVNDSSVLIGPWCRNMASWNLIKSGSGDHVLLDSTKLKSEPMLTDHNVAYTW